MKPCAAPLCPAFATRGDYCPCHAKLPPYDPEYPCTPEETAAAIAQRERIARLYNRGQQWQK